MELHKARERRWEATGEDGIERSLFRENGAGGRASVVRLAAGRRFPSHTHLGGEEVVVLEGRVTIGGIEMERGDYLYTETGEEHDVVALENAIIFVSSSAATRFVEG